MIGDELAVGLLDHRDRRVEARRDQANRHAGQQRARDRGMPQAIDRRAVRQACGLRGLDERPAVRVRAPASPSEFISSNGSPASRPAAAASVASPDWPRSVSAFGFASCGFGPSGSTASSASARRRRADRRRRAGRSGRSARRSRREPRHKVRIRADRIGARDDSATLLVAQNQVAFGVVGLGDRGEPNRPRLGVGDPVVVRGGEVERGLERLAQPIDAARLASSSASPLRQCRSSRTVSSETGLDSSDGVR